MERRRERRSIRSRLPAGILVPAALAALVLQTVAAVAVGTPPTGQWTMAGQNIADTHNAPAEHAIGAANAGALTERWQVATAGDVSATPTVGGGLVYFPDFGGQLWAVSAATGQVVWSHAVSDYTGVAGDASRTSPAIHGDEIVFGDGTMTTPGLAGAFIIAAQKTTGRKLWATQVDAHPGAIITSAPVIYGGVVYVGVSSKEESVLAGQPGYQCCTFRGSVVALDAASGRMLWKTFMTPDNGGKPGGYSGDAIWGSTPAIDPAAGLLYVGVGNEYSVPAGVCQLPNQTGCTAPAQGDFVDSAVALDLQTGAVRWVTRTLSADNFTIVCGIPPIPTCGPDFDFGTGPNLFTLPSGRQLVGLGQKSGAYYAFDALTGSMVWRTQIGPGSVFGGTEWGAATDGKRIYVTEGDGYGQPYTITSATGQQSTTSGGSWAALDPATGAILWQVADPQQAIDISFTSVANGVVYEGSDAISGKNMYALDAGTGRILWGFASGGSVVSGAAIVDGMVFWGSGYRFGSACPGAATTTTVCNGDTNRVFAFSLPSS